MEQQSRPEPSTPASSTQDAATATTSPALCFRNLDADRSYDLLVRAVDLDDLSTFEQSYTLAPGEVRCDRTPVPPGRYSVAVTPHGEYPETVTTRLSEHPADTVLVECGNGVVSVTANPF